MLYILRRAYKVSSTSPASRLRANETMAGELAKPAEVLLLLLSVVFRLVSAVVSEVANAVVGS